VACGRTLVRCPRQADLTSQGSINVNFGMSASRNEPPNG
jgi:hypothetical protein